MFCFFCHGSIVVVVAACADIFVCTVSIIFVAMVSILSIAIVVILLFFSMLLSPKLFLLLVALFSCCFLSTSLL